MIEGQLFIVELARQSTVKWGGFRMKLQKVAKLNLSYLSINTKDCEALFTNCN